MSHKKNFNKIYLSVIIPQYNELSNLKKGLLHKALQYLEKAKYSCEVIVVDDGSTDGSLEYLHDNYKRSHSLKIIKANHGGKPKAIYNGLKVAVGKYILFTDMDQSTPISEIGKLLHFIPKYKVVIGSRGNKRISATRLRKVAGKTFSTFRKLFILRNIDDTQCGFKLFEGNLIKEFFPKLSVLENKNVRGWSVSAFDVELLHLITKYGIKVKEVKVVWQDEDISNTKNRKFLYESLDMVKQVLTITFKEVTGKYREV